MVLFFSSTRRGFNSLWTINVLCLLWNNLSMNGFINYYQIRLCNRSTWLHIRHWIQEVSFVCHQCLLSLRPLCQISLYVSTLFPGRWPEVFLELSVSPQCCLEIERALILTLVIGQTWPSAGVQEVAADNYPGLDRWVNVTTSCGFWADLHWYLAVGLCEAVQYSSSNCEHVGTGTIPALPVYQSVKCDLVNGSSQLVTYLKVIHALRISE